MAAVTGTFLADFSSFYDAVQKANVSLKGMETNAHTVETRMGAMANAFSGRKIVQDATVATEAVTAIGGATKLTATEAAKLNAQITEAIAKYKALGQTAPKELHDMAAATAKVKDESAKLPSTFGTITSSLTAVAGAFGLAFSAQALVGFVSGVVGTAGKIADLSAKLGISTEAVQRFTYAAEQAGGTIDDVGTAIFKMNEKISEGSKGTAAALTDLGLKLSDIRTMKTEDAFRAITAALKDIDDPMTRARLEMELFGKAGGALSAAITAGFGEVGDAATVMATDTVQALDRAGDAWARLKNGIVVATGTALGSTLTFFEKIEKRFDEIVVKTGKWYGLAPPKGFTPEGNRIEPPKPDVNLPLPGGRPGAAELERLQREREAAARKAEAARKQEEAQDARIFAGLKQRAAMYEQEEKTLYQSVTALQAYVREHRTAAEVISATIPAAATEAYTGYGKAIEHISGALARNTAEMTQWAKASGANAQQAHAFFQQLPTATEEFNKLGIAISQFSGQIGSNLLGTLGNAISMFSHVKSAIGDVRGGFDKITSGGGLTSILGGFTSIVGGIGGIVSAAQSAIQIGKALWSVFDRNKGRDAVKDFAESFGGFDALHAQLLTLGEAGEALWVKLTQGVGRNNPEQAAKVIAEVEDALKKQKDASDDAADATEEEARATIETASEAQKALDALAPKITANEEAWAHWRDTVNGYIDSIAANLKSLELPTLSPMQAQAATAGGGGTAVLQVDSQVIAEAVVPKIPGVVRRYGLA